MNSADYKKIFRFHQKTPNRILSRESGWLEFKESFNWNSKSKYAKSIAAFANNKGGYIVFGIKNKPKDIIGLQNNKFGDIDEAKISEYLNSVFSPEIEFEKFVLNIKSKTIGILYVYISTYKPVVCLKPDGDIKEAEIYYRYNARSEKIKYPELKLLLERIQEQERKSWMEHFERISKIGPSNAATLDTTSGKITGSGGTLIIDEKLISKLKFITEGNFKQKGFPTLKLIGNVKPVSMVGHRNERKRILRITDDPSAPAVRLKEEEILKEFSLDYSSLREELQKRYSDFKQNGKYHKIRNELKKKNGLCRVRYLDPNNPGSTRKDFYHPNILKKFDKYYRLKRHK